MVFEAFSPQARHAVMLAQELARTSYERRIRTMDLLVALSRVPDSESVGLLVGQVDDLTAWFDRRRQRARLLRRREKAGHIRFSSDLRSVIRDAVPRGGGDVVSTRHLVEALAAVPLTSAWTWMNRHGLSSNELAVRTAGTVGWEVRGAPEPGTEPSGAAPPRGEPRAEAGDPPAGDAESSP